MLLETEIEVAQKYIDENQNPTLSDVVILNILDG